MTETCELLGLSRWTVTKLIESGELDAMKGPAKNSPFRITKASVDGYISRHIVKATG
jgi:excisionase family DNA binding protein